METIIIKIDKRTKAGSAFWEVLERFAKDDGVSIEKEIPASSKKMTARKKREFIDKISKETNKRIAKRAREYYGLS